MCQTLRLRLVLIALALLCFSLAVPFRASPLKEPKRSLSGGVVDLHPLFQWWTNHTGPRPLTAWVHLTGSIVGTNVYGWVLEGHAEQSERARAAAPAGGHDKIILQHPPLQDRAEFEKLSAQLKALNEQHGKLSSIENQAKADHQVNNRIKADLHRQGVRARNVSAEARQDRAIENEAKAEIKPLDQQIQAVKAQLAVYPNPDHYVVDCFALETSQAAKGMPVYDYGYVLK
jgi:hypothetical protein